MTEYSKKFIKTHILEIIFSIPKTIYFNFKVLPFKYAIKFPYIISYHVKLIGVNRNNFLTLGKNLSTFSMRIGFGDSITSRRESPKGLICIENDGQIQVGEKLGMSQGCIIYANNAKVIIGNNFRCNYSTTIDCTDKNIEIGNNVVIGWNVTIKNSDGHYILEKKVKKSNSNKIVIENHIWVCANATLLKGIHIKNNSVIAYGSILTKTVNNENVLYAGIPAKAIKNDICWEE